MLHTAIPGDPRDTRPPHAMAGSLESLALGTVLSASSRTRLRNWLFATKTGVERLRAGLPAAWSSGDKTGTQASPPNRSPIVVAAYFTGSTQSPDARSAVLAEAGRIVASAFA